GQPLAKLDQVLDDRKLGTVVFLFFADVGAAADPVLDFIDNRAHGVRSSAAPAPTGVFSPDVVDETSTGGSIAMPFECGTSTDDPACSPGSIFVSSATVTSRSRLPEADVALASDAISPAWPTSLESATAPATVASSEASTETLESTRALEETT